MEEFEAKILKLVSSNYTKEKGFNLLIDSFKERLYWQIQEITNNHEDTNDVLQNVFVKVWRYIDNFKQDSKLSTWLYRITRNESLSYVSSKYKRTISPISDENKEYLFNHIESDVFVDEKSILDKLEEAINALPKKQKEVFKLRYYKEMKYTEMSKLLATSESALKTSYHLAVKKIEENLKED